MQTFDQFIQDWKGETPGYDGVEENIGQCVQLFNFYNRDVVGAPNWWIDYAHELYTRFDENSPLYPYYDKIEYTSGATPERGCVVIYSPILPGTKGAGHVDMSTRPGVVLYEAFSCNWGGKQAHLVEHDFSYVLGWLRPKKGRVMDENDARQLYSIAMHRQPESDAAWQHWVGKKFSDFADTQFVPGSEWHRQNHVLKVAYPEAKTQADRVPTLEAKVSELGKALSTYQMAAGDVEATLIGKALIKVFQTFGYKK